MTLCSLCQRRKGNESRFDDDSIGLLCPLCHRDLVRFLHLLIETAVIFRGMDTQCLLRLLETMMNVGVS